ncbi:type II toxin-antitoxin system CcdA family antitoxin [Euzebya sp.]|uniref:type II toxin-antitoxin system CcdA family antitoxin n=1 Tax=Euzebya sp. TaxID=1971409 RepID=UPI003514AAE7
MPKVSVYLPDDLYDRARRGGLSLSELAQRAVEQELRDRSVANWIRAVRARPRRSTETSIGTGDLMDAVREEFGA